MAQILGEVKELFGKRRENSLNTLGINLSMYDKYLAFGAKGGNRPPRVLPHRILKSDSPLI